MAQDVYIPEEVAIQEDGTVLYTERTSHTAGGHWRVHKSDADDVWPSDFHAHNLEDPREKMDMYTGDVYNSTTKKYLFTLKAKTMRYIYADMKASKDAEIRNKCNGDNEKFSYLKG